MTKISAWLGWGLASRPLFDFELLALWNIEQIPPHIDRARPCKKEGSYARYVWYGSPKSRSAEGLFSPLIAYRTLCRSVRQREKKEGGHRQESRFLSVEVGVLYCSCAENLGAFVRDFRVFFVAQR